MGEKKNVKAPGMGGYFENNKGERLKLTRKQAEALAMRYAKKNKCSYSSVWECDSYFRVGCC